MVTALHTGQFHGEWVSVYRVAGTWYSKPIGYMRSPRSCWSRWSWAELLIRRTPNEQDVHVPESLKATVARLQQAEVVFLPASRQLVPGRRIVGATIRTRDLDALQRVLSDASWSVPAVVPTTNGRSMFVPPSTAHGIWLEFRQEQGG